MTRKATTITRLGERSSLPASSLALASTLATRSCLLPVSLLASHTRSRSSPTHTHRRRRFPCQPPLLSCPRVLCPLFALTSCICTCLLSLSLFDSLTHAPETRVLCVHLSVRARAKADRVCSGDRERERERDNADWLCLCLRATLPVSQSVALQRRCQTTRVTELTARES